MTFYTNILVAYDASEKSKKALEKAKELALLDKNVHLHVVTVWDAPFPDYHEIKSTFNFDEFKKPFQQAAEAKIKEAAESLKGIENQVTALTVEGHPSTAIINYAEQNKIDLIVIGNRGFGAIKKMFLGSVSHNVLQEAPCPVLIVK